MVKIAGSKKLKRQMAPLFWGITRKDKRFVVTVRPGSHSKDFSIPTVVFLRDTLRVVSSLREAKSVIYGGKVKIDGIKRKSLHHSIGLMDVVELENVDEIYRLVPKKGRILEPLKITESEKSKKLSQVTSKTTINGGKIQIGFHDGRSIISDKDVKVGDSCLIEIPNQKIIDILRLEKGTQIIVKRGINAGQRGTIQKVEEGTFILPTRVLVALGDREIEIPTNLVIPVGKDKPVIKVGE